VPTVLIVDDDSSIRTVVSVNLLASGFGVLEAATGDLGLEIVGREHVDIVLLDVMMPGKSGWEVAASLRERAGAPFVFMSAKAEVEDQLRGLELGALDYVTKPFDPVTLVTRLEELLGAIERGDAQAVRRQRLERLLPADSPGP
jgi:DNA-binding response OmpR family regulator